MTRSWRSAAACLAAVASLSTGEVRGMEEGRSATETIVLGAGCFWCAEAIFQRLEGVLAVTPGYAGGHLANPTYEQVCTGETGHAEVARIAFDPARVSLAEILDLFWRAHDPTTLDRQGPDTGTQYRSVIFTADARQEEIAKASRRAAQARFADPVVTAIAPLPNFYPAEEYHRNYFNRNGGQPYCRLVIAPKLGKLGLGANPPRAGE